MGRIDRQLTDTPRTDGLLRRIDYLRQTASVPRTGLNAPPGENPYDVEFGVLPYSEIIRLLDIHIPIGTKLKVAERGKRITRNALFAYMGRLNEQKFAAFRRGGRDEFGRVILRKLSRALSQIDAGTLALRDGKLTHVEAPAGAPPRKRGMTFTLSLETGPRGVLRPTIRPGAPLEAPRQMPKLFQSFKLPGA